MGRKHDQKIAELVGKPFGLEYEKISQRIDDMVATQKKMDKSVTDANAVLSSMDKKNLFDLNTPLDIATLEQSEKEYLVAALYTVANACDHVSESQQRYLRSVQDYLGIKNGQVDGVDFGRLDSGEIFATVNEQKMLMQVIREFLFLENCNHNYAPDWEDVFDKFNLSPSGVKTIVEHINKIYKATGEEGLAEKYGYKQQESEDANIQAKALEPHRQDTSSVSKGLADFIDQKCDSAETDCIETDHYVVIWPYYTIAAGHDESELMPPMDKSILRMDKTTGEWQTFIMENDLMKTNDLIAHTGDFIFYFGNDDSTLYRFDLRAFSSEKICSEECSVESFSVYGNLLAYANEKLELCILNIICKEMNVVSFDEFFGQESAVFSVYTADDIVYLVASTTVGTPEDGIPILKYDIATKTTTVLCNREGLPRLLYCGHDIVCYSERDNNRDQDVPIYWGKFKKNQAFKIEEVTAALSWIDPFIRAYPDCLLFVNEDGKIASLDYSTGKTIIIAPAAETEETITRGIFKKAKTHYEPKPFRRIGSWIYYDNDSLGRVRVSLEHPGQVEPVAK